MSATKNAFKLKSKTINFNALYLALVAVVGAFGITLEPEVVAAGSTILNILLRFVTDAPLADK